MLLSLYAVKIVKKNNLIHFVLFAYLFEGVIAVVIFISASALALLGRFICSRKETYRNQEVKASQPEDIHELPFSSQADSQGAPRENQKEFFI